MGSVRIALTGVGYIDYSYLYQQDTRYCTKTYTLCLISLWKNPSHDVSGHGAGRLWSLSNYVQSSTTTKGRTSWRLAIDPFEMVREK